MSGPDPQWQEDAWRAVVGELREFVITAWQVTIAPRRFAAEWSDGRLHTLNPLMFTLNGLAAVSVWQATWNRILGRTLPDVPLWLELSRPVWPLLLTLLWTMVAHALIRALGGKRPLRSSLAMTFFTGGGPLALVTILCTPLEVWMRVHPLPILWMGLGGLALMLGLFGSVITYPTLALAGVHRVGGWRIAIGVVVATIAEVMFILWLALRHKTWLILFGST